MIAHIPVEAFPPWEYIVDELNARGWSVNELAERMGGDVVLNRCELDFLSLADPRIILGQSTADGLGRAFGASSELWMNLDESYRLAREAGRPWHPESMPTVDAR